MLFIPLQYKSCSVVMASTKEWKRLMLNTEAPTIANYIGGNFTLSEIIDSVSSVDCGLGKVKISLKSALLTTFG